MFKMTLRYYDVNGGSECITSTHLTWIEAVEYYLAECERYDGLISVVEM